MKKNKKVSQLNDAPLTQPQNRTERFLAKIAKLADTAPADTRNRLERYLAAIVQSTAGAGTISTDTETTVEGILFGNSITGKVEGIVSEMSAQEVADYLEAVEAAVAAGGIVNSSQLNEWLSNPTNVRIYDNVNKPGIYVKRAAQTLNKLLNTTNTSVHPAFMIGGTQKSVLYFGKYQGSQQNDRIYSLPGVDPQTNINLDTFVARCRAKGAGHHCMTAAEWAFLALLCKKAGTQPKGNNNSGKDITEDYYIAIPTYMNGSNIYRVATGTGSATWSDTGDRDGIFDLNGNIWEWIADIRMVYGELQVIPYNNAAMDNIDMSATSSEWKAINAAATGWNDLFITPDGSGTTTNSVKLNWGSGHWRWQAAAITKTSQNGIFGNIDFDGVSDFAKLYLRAMALAPDEGATAADYNSDNVWANTNEAERCAFRGGRWDNGALCGVFALNFTAPRSYSGVEVGGRPNYYE